MVEQNIRYHLDLSVLSLFSVNEPLLLVLFPFSLVSLGKFRRFDVIGSILVTLSMFDDILSECSSLFLNLIRFCVVNHMLREW